ncbi:hypothetical protein Lfee_1228 [Legionella feeleii]|uniref:Uncharacterized protein n=1 Tax=Legionella feeleii TaxID=453 RepID=A0A0W0U0J7_9GAMM|nr:hypothetical protein Lfee_1228 [Legionella feeleii]SPX62297.1 Uncharacterised protein [Legionella feeleii]
MLRQSEVNSFFHNPFKGLRYVISSLQALAKQPGMILCYKSVPGRFTSFAMTTDLI